MDELTFQEELRELKQRVSRMSTNPRQYIKPSVSHYSTSAHEQDNFIRELQDLKAQVDGLQCTLGQRYQQWHGQDDITPQSPPPAHNNSLVQFPPSVPIFWQLFMSLRTDVRHIDERVATMETGFSELEDRVDKLDPRMSTPPGSEAENEEVHVEHAAPTVALGVRHDRNQQRADSTELAPADPSNSTDVDEFKEAVARYMGHLEDLGVYLCHDDCDCPKSCDCCDDCDLSCKRWSPFVSFYENSFRAIVGDRPPTIALGMLATAEIAFSIILERTRLSASPEQLRTSGVMRCVCLDPHAPFVAAAEVLRNSMSITATGEKESALQEGIAFRDKEIARLDELLRESTETARVQEEALAHKDARIHSLDLALEKTAVNAKAWERFAKDRHRELEEAKISTQKVKAELTGCEASRHHFMTKYVDENYRLSWYKQELACVQQKSQARVAELENALLSLQSAKEEELASRDHEIEKLLGFCDQKDNVAQRHEEIVQRGARMMAERDVEIDRLRNDLLRSDSSIRHAREHSAKLISTLRKRDNEIEDLRDDIAGERSRQNRGTRNARREADLSKRRSMPAMGPNNFSSTLGRTQVVEPFADAARAAGHEHRAPIPWAPQSIREYSRLPHEEDRAFLWEKGTAGSEKHRFEAISQIHSRDDSASKARFHDPVLAEEPRSSRRKQVDGHRADHRAVRFEPPPTHDGPRDQQSSLRSSNSNSNSNSSNSSSDSSYYSTSRHAAERAHGVSRTEVQPSTTRVSSQRRTRHALPMDATLWPPLPAPVVAAEVADTNGGERVAARADTQPSNGRSAIAKSASMPELPRSTLASLQAYVETEAEAESGDDGAEDGSLLD